MENKKENLENTYIVNENTILDLEEELAVQHFYNFYSCIEEKILPIIKSKYNNLLKSNTLTYEEIRKVAINIVNKDIFNIQLNNLIVEELKKIEKRKGLK